MNDDAFFRALADPVRRQLLDRLRTQNGQTLNQLCGGFDLTRQGVAKHLAVLEDANLVTTLKRGREKLHFLNPVPLAETLRRWVGRFEEARLDAMTDFKAQMEQAQDKEKRRA